MAAERRRSALAGARRAAGHTQETLAAILNVDRSTVIRWEAGEHAPQPYLRPRLARVLGRTSAQLSELIDDVPIRPGAPSEANSSIVDVDAALSWIDLHLGASSGSSGRKLSQRLKALDKRALHDRNGQRAKVGRRDVTQALSTYYLGSLPPYRVRVDGHVVSTSILCQADWQNLALPLLPTHDRLSLSRSATRISTRVDDVAATHAVRRVAESIALHVRLTDDPIYRLLDLDVRDGTLVGEVGLAPFVEYALTADLLEGELLDALVTGESPRPGSLPLRHRYLPDLDSVFDLPGRLCAGGVLALCAIARPADQFRGADYLLLVQRRSGYVLNATHQLAVIPKGFHKPVADPRADVQVGATLRREMEQELFGRTDIDSTVTRNMTAAPMHPSRLSEPMSWLSETQDALRMECTGVGLNLVSGNYEFASLVLIEDEEFWSRFGGHIEANWEAAGLRLYSSLDRELVTELVADQRWSNEGLFAFLQGIRRLRELGGPRVNLPVINQ